MGVPQNRCFISEQPVNIDGFEVPLFQESTIYMYTPREWTSTILVSWTKNEIQ